MGSMDNNQETKKPSEKVSDALTLGKRHASPGIALGRMDQIARKIGFSREEISELKRIYSTEFNGTSHRSRNVGTSK